MHLFNGLCVKVSVNGRRTPREPAMPASEIQPHRHLQQPEFRKWASQECLPSPVGFRRLACQARDDLLSLHTCKHPVRSPLLFRTAAAAAARRNEAPPPATLPRASRAGGPPLHCNTPHLSPQTPPWPAEGRALHEGGGRSVQESGGGRSGPRSGGRRSSRLAHGVVFPSSASSSSRLKGRSKGQYSPPLSPDLGAQLPSLPPPRLSALGSNAARVLHFCLSSLQVDLTSHIVRVLASLKVRCSPRLCLFPFPLSFSSFWSWISSETYI
jgi:hypothetical protein